MSDAFRKGLIEQQASMYEFKDDPSAAPPGALGRCPRVEVRSERPSRRCRASGAAAMSESAATVGSVWEMRYRVLGRSAVWPDMYVCEILSGPDKGEKIVLDGDRFSGERTSNGRPIQALAPARRRAREAA